MTTTQPAPNGPCVSPPLFPVEHPAELNSAALPTDKADINSNTFRSQISDLPSPEARPSFPASAYHVPPKLFAPKADSFRNTIPEGWGRTKLPERCQFMFSDGRQCTMARSDIHPSLCVYHSDREEQLFGDPGGRCEAKTLDFPELHSACRDLSTPAGVNRALAQVFRLLARGRISRQEAATFAKLGHLLLQTISAMRAEIADMPELAPGHQTAPTAPPSSDLSVSEEAVAAAPDSAETQPIESNSRTINTSVNRTSNPPKINTCEIPQLNPVQNQHLQNKRGRACATGSTE